MWLPPGIVIPVAVHGARPVLWGVLIRRHAGDPKYVHVTGGGNALFGAHDLSLSRPAMIVEGALDALVVSQAAGDIVTPVATLSTHGARRAKWIGALALTSDVLVSFDADEAGQSAAQYWLRILQNGKAWPPLFGDPSDMWERGGDMTLRRWVLEGLDHAIDEDEMEAYLERFAICNEGKLSSEGQAGHQTLAV